MKNSEERKFEVAFMAEAAEFVGRLELKAQRKVLYNIRKSQHIMDVSLLKKLNSRIWEFRTLYNGISYRFFAFWDENEQTRRLVVVTHGIIKKSDKTPLEAIEKAEQLRILYLKEKREHEGKK